MARKQFRFFHRHLRVGITSIDQNDRPFFTMAENGIGHCTASIIAKLSIHVTNRFAFQETHIMHRFDDDFYGSQLKACIIGHIRPEKNFKSLGEFAALPARLARQTVCGPHRHTPFVASFRHIPSVVSFRHIPSAAPPSHPDCGLCSSSPRL